MLKEPAVANRQFRQEDLECDLVIVGGGMAGVCGAITAARAGIRVTLIQDRPVLGGNASSEVRLWILGATAHMGNNNRWSREGGVLDEILVENLYRNPEGNALILDTILLEKVVSEPTIRLLLNTAVIEVTKAQPDRIESVRAFCSQNSTMYAVNASLFCDASGDGVVGFLAGAAFRMGAEAEADFGEPLAPSQEWGELLGHSLYFYTKDVGKPVQFVPPSFALTDVTQIPRFRSFTTQEYGCRLWWIEYGGRLDTVHDTEKIKWELWKVVYGVWDYIKNSGQFPEAETLTLEWVGTIPGKRESRRFEGDYMLRQQDIIEQRFHYDAVAFGGWAIDLHPADGVFSEKPGCTQWHSRGIYSIPYRSLYSRNISNLFLAGRIISVSHVAFGSSRVMATCAYVAQAVGMAAALCAQNGLKPADLAETGLIGKLQLALQRIGQHLPGLRLHDPDDLVQTAHLAVSSELHLAELPPDGPLLALTTAWAQMLPVAAGPLPRLEFRLDAAQPTTLEVELRTGARPDNYTPDHLLASYNIAVEAGQDQTLPLVWPDLTLDEARYVFVCFRPNPVITLHTSQTRLTGVLSVANKHNPAVAETDTQLPPANSGIEAFELWCPQRRPGGHNLAVQIKPPLALFGPANVANGLARPTSGPNAWVADFADDEPTLTLDWQAPQIIGRVELSFDNDWDHALESVLMGHQERTLPFCVKHYALCDDGGRTLFEQTDNHQTRNTLVFDPPVTTRRLSLHLRASQGHNVPAALFEVRCYPV